MAGYIGNKSSVTLVDGYTEAEADAEFVAKSTTGNLTLDVSGDIILDAAGTEVQLYKAGTKFGKFTTNSTPLGFYIDAEISDGDMFFRGNDGGSTITALTLDMSAAGAATFNSTIAAGAATFTTADNTNQLTLVSTDADANAGPNLNLRRNSASPADGDLTGQLTFTNNNDAGEGTDYVTIHALSADVSNGSEDAAFYIKTMSAGTLRQRISIDNNATTFNEDGENLDFRVESDNSTHMLFVDAGNNRVGIGESSPSARLEIGGMAAGEQALLIESGRNDALSNGLARINITDSNCPFAGLQIDHAGTGAAIIANGNVLVGTATADPSGVNGVQINGGSKNYFVRDSTATVNQIHFRNPNGTVGKIMTSGSSTSYNTSSDYRLKENVVDLTGASARVNQLDVKRFNFIADDTNTLVDGFLAHEVATVVPEAIAGAKDALEVWEDDEELPDGVSVGDNKLDDDGNTIPDYQGIDQSKLVPLLTAALQEALTEIASLKTRVEALEA
ncbi:tail fiber domain-containing protein [Litorivicinus sp.]|nr:tail fiber domain-containing protein [Litorivicinus sp.]